MKLLAFFMFLTSLAVSSQETMQLQEGQVSPLASLQAISWLSGHWSGEAFGGIAEEIWSAPSGGTMMFVFRLINGGKISFYEIGHIKEFEGTLVKQLKHFDGDLKGWEEKGETVDFKLVKLEENAIYFEGLTIKRIAEDNIQIIVLVKDGETTEEVVFDYRLVKPE